MKKGKGELIRRERTLISKERSMSQQKRAIIRGENGVLLAPEEGYSPEMNTGTYENGKGAHIRF